MTTATLPRWPRLAAPLAGLWYAFGLSQCIMAFMADASVAPALIWLAYAAACTFGLFGAVALAFAPARAALLFVISLVSALVFYGWLFGLGSPLPQDYGIGAAVLIVTTLLLLLSRRLD